MKETGDVVQNKAMITALWPINIMNYRKTSNISRT